MSCLAPALADNRPVPVKSKGKGKAKAKAPPPPSLGPSSSGSGSGSGSDSDSDEGSDAEDGAGEDKAAMLAALEAHSRALLGLPSTSAEGSGSGSGANSASGSDSESEGGDDDDDYDDEFDDGWGAGDAMVTDSEDEFAPSLPKRKASKPSKPSQPFQPPSAAAPPPSAPAVVEVVFAPTSGGRTEVSRADKKAFLKGTSSKLMGGGVPSQLGVQKTKEEAEDASNARLDQELHSMLLQDLLPSASSASRPVEKRNAISGRLRELASDSRPGEGAADLRSTARLSSHPAKVRTGLMHAAQRRAEAARSESEAAGSWVKGIGGLGDLGRGSGAGKRPNMETREERTFGDTKKKRGMAGTGGAKKRAMGLGMGVGRFQGGALKISDREIERVNGMHKQGKRSKGPGKMKGW